MLKSFVFENRLSVSKNRFFSIIIIAPYRRQIIERLSWTCDGEANRNPRPWTDNRLWHHLTTHNDLISHNSLWSRQLRQYEKLNNVTSAGGFLWSQAGLWSLCSGQGICDRHAAHLFEVGGLFGHANTWLFRWTGDHPCAVMLRLSIMSRSTCPCWYIPGHCLCSTARFS